MKRQRRSAGVGWRWALGVLLTLWGLGLCSGVGAQGPVPPLRVTLKFGPGAPENATYSPAAEPKLTLVIQVENVSGAAVHTVEGFSALAFFRRLVFVRGEDGAIVTNKAEEQLSGHSRLYHCFSRGRVLAPVAVQVVPAERLPGAPVGDPQNFFREFVIDDARRPEFYGPDLANPQGSPGVTRPGRYRVTARIPLQWFDPANPDAFIADCDQFEGVPVVNVARVAGRFETVLESNTLEFVIEGTAPAITIASPVDGATYGIGQTVHADYTCTNAGAGVASCQGLVADGSAIDTATPGVKTFTVQAADQAGNTRSASVTYTVADLTPPELAARCAPPSKDPAVTGRNGGTATLTAKVPATRPFNFRETFTVVDAAGDRLVATFGVNTSVTNATTFAIQSLAYNAQTPSTPTLNNLTCLWRLDRSGRITSLTQNVLLVVGKRTDVVARFDPQQNRTEIRVLRQGQPPQTVTRPGMVFLNLTTNQGVVGVEY